MARSGRFALLRVMEIPAMRRLLTAYAVSKVGDMLYSTSLVVVTLQRTGSPSWVSAVVIANLLPYAVVSPFAGVLADRMDRRRLMMLTDAGRALLMVVAALLVVTEAPIGLMLVVAFLSASVGSPFTSALNALLPEIVDEDRLPAANAAVQALLSAGLLIGPILSTLVLSRGVQWLPFALNAATFVVSASLLAGLRLARAPGMAAVVAPETAAGTAPEVRERESFGRALLTGLGAVFGSPLLRWVLVIAVPALFAYGLEQVITPLVSRDLLGTGEAGAGLLVASTGLGGVLGVAVAVRLARWDRVLVAFSVAVILSTLPLGLLSVTSVPVVAYALLLVEGLGSVCLEVVLVTALQRILPLDQVARVDALLTSVAVVATVAGNAAAPALVGGIGLRPTLAWTAFGCAAVSLVAAIAGAGQRVSVRTPDLVAFLRRVASLDGLDEAGYEALAAAAGPEQVVGAGETLLAQGAPADEVLLLVTGSCDVFATGRDAAGSQVLMRVNQVSGPDLLGEIGVLRRTPRTATVVATGGCVVRRLPAEAFAAVLRPGSALPTALSITVHARLGRWSG